MRRIVIANWKMNTTIHQGKELVCDIKDKLGRECEVEVVLCPPATHLKSLCSEIIGNEIKLGSQNIFHEEAGAYTGEISVKQIKEFCSYVLIGHSERRALGETSEQIAKKIKLTVKNGLTPVLCVGEDAKTRKANKTNQLIKSQLLTSLKELRGAGQKSNSSSLVIAYEPIWAIGSGKQPTPEEIEEVAELIKKTIGQKTQILYGGSVTAKNAKTIAQISNISGVLVGGASLKAGEFVKIIKIFENK